MDLQSIREKYRQILYQDYPNKQNTGLQASNESQEQEQSQVQWINMARQQKRKRILTQSSSNPCNVKNAMKQHSGKSIPNKKAVGKLSSQSMIIDLKQKLAQSLLNCSRKDAQMSQFQHLLLRKNQQLNSHQRTISELKKVIKQKDDRIVDEQTKFDAVQKIVRNKDNTIRGLRVQNQQLKQHIQHYNQQILALNDKVSKGQEQFRKLERELSKNDLLKSKIKKVKDDSKRLQFLLSDHQLYAPLLVSLQGKHFLGKPLKQSKQLQYWYPQTLINGVQIFLKKHQVGHGNKNFSQNLVKFISGLLQRSQKNGQKRGKSKHISRVKQFQRKKNQILNVSQLGSEQIIKNKSSRNSRLCASSFRKSMPLNGNSELKSRDFSICLEKSLCLQRQTLSSTKNMNKQDNKFQNKKSFVIESLQRTAKLNQNRKKHIILQIIESFCKGLQKLFKLQNKVLAQEKMIQLCNWLKQSVDQIYEPQKQQNNEVNNPIGKWKTVGDL